MKTTILSFRPSDHEVVAGEDSITVDGKEIKIYKEADANNLPWGDLDVDVVLECTGFYTSKAKAQAHINAGAKKVVISAPAGNDLPTIVYNVNHETLTAEDNIISAASCTTNCLAPMAKGLNDFAPIVSGIMTTIHAWTGDQMPLDGPQRKGNKRRSRACAVNIVPNTTGAAKAIGLVLPELNGKLIGAAQRVPTPTGSITNLYAVVDKKVTVDEVNAAMKAYAATISETFGYNEDERVVGVVPVSGHMDLVGGISPLGQRTHHKTVLDESALQYDEILLSGGKRGFSVGVNPNDLLKVLDAVAAPIGTW